MLSPSLVGVGRVRTQIVLGQMALQIAGVVKNPNNIDRGFASAAINEKMSRLSDYSQVTPGTIGLKNR
jgi:hypothetical protein